MMPSAPGIQETTQTFRRLMPQKCRCIRVLQRPPKRKGGGYPGPERSNGEFQRHGVLNSPTSKSALWAHHDPVIEGALAGLGFAVDCTGLYPPWSDHH